MFQSNTLSPSLEYGVKSQFSTLKIEAPHSSEMSVSTHQTTQHHIPEVGMLLGEEISVSNGTMEKFNKETTDLNKVNNVDFNSTQ
jgi:hypothetical protein